MSGARVIGVDVGTSSAKGVAIDERATVLAEAEHPIPVSIRLLLRRGLLDQRVAQCRNARR